MPTELYSKYYKSFYPVASDKISQLLLENIKDDQTVLEVGFGSGHLMFLLTEAGHKPDGIEIRSDAYEKVKNIFLDAKMENVLINGDFLSYSDKHDVIYTTGLVQCLQDSDRERFINHIAELCHKAIIVVPEIITDRNINSADPIAVSGCAEFCTQNLIAELYKFFNYIRQGRWSSDELNLDDSFLYYICLNI